LVGAGVYGLQFAQVARAAGWPIVAAFNRAGEKVGRDLGALAGAAEDWGVIVEDFAAADSSRLDADVGVVFTTDSLKHNWPIYQRLIGAGLNVICHGVEAYYPQRYDADTSAAIDVLATQHGVTFTGTGIWDMTRIWAGIALAGASVSIKSLRHTSVTQVNSLNPKIVANFGLDLTREDYAQRFGGPVGANGKYQAIPELVLGALGFQVMPGREVREPIVSAEPVFCRALERDISAGRVVGWRYRSIVETQEGVSAECSMEMRLLGDGEKEEMVWEVSGSPPNRLVVERTDSRLASAAAVLNRIPDVIAAPPGIRLLTELGPMRPHALNLAVGA